MEAAQQDAVMGCKSRLASAAIDGLTALIKEAVQASDDERVAELDQVLRNIEKLIELTGEPPSGQSPPALDSVHERQSPYTATSRQKLRE